MEEKPKHRQVRTWFNLKIKGKNYTVRPYNAETTRKHRRDVSWSHGFTHFEVKETGETRFSGVNWFDDHAKPLKKPKKPPARSDNKAAAPAPEGIRLMKPPSFKR